MIKLKSLLQEQTTLFKQGMRDPKVGTKEGPIAKIQQKLIDAGIMNPIPEASYGHYGPKTAAAVVEFQKKQFPDEPDAWDGKVGKNTTAALNKISSTSNNNFKFDYGTNVPGMSTFVSGADRDEIERKLNIQMNTIQDVAKTVTKTNKINNDAAYLKFNGDELQWITDGAVIKTWPAVSGLTFLNTPPSDYNKLINRYVKTPDEFSKDKNAGPLPAGTWSVGPIQTKPGSQREINMIYAIYKQATETQRIDFNIDSELSRLSWGNYRAYINPVTYKGPRGSFYVHGGALPGSHGCIDLTTKMDDFAKFYSAWLIANNKTSIKLVVGYESSLLNTAISTLWKYVGNAIR
jgi:hypothetical protein